MNEKHVMIDHAELAVRMAEAATCEERPMPDAVEALAVMDPIDRREWLAAAAAAVDYLFGILNAEGVVTAIAQQAHPDWPASGRMN
jgi:hypothetical protein